MLVRSMRKWEILSLNPWTNPIQENDWLETGPASVPVQPGWKCYKWTPSSWWWKTSCNVHHSSKINQESTEATDDLQFSLYIWWQEERCQVSSQTEEVDEDWFPDPVFIKSQMQTGKSIIQMRDKETTTAAYLGLEVKYPKIEMKIRLNIFLKIIIISI